ncbi:uncharacterized protein TNCV_4182701 [Trichonephila clavipes]|nr:uncharacterized protein TNCV_4182701 [Trichonephila clavipes]
MRFTGNGFAGTFKLCSKLNLPRLIKTAYKSQESKPLKVVQEVDGTWQRSGYTSMNGCVAAVSVDTGKLLDIEVMSSYCPTLEKNRRLSLQYTQYYGAGDSKALLNVKDTYGTNNVTKFECIGHVQKRVGLRLRKKLKDCLIKANETIILSTDFKTATKLLFAANAMQLNVIAALYHCASSYKELMHGQ